MQTCVVQSRQSIALKPQIVILVITLNCHSWITDLYILLNLKDCVIWLTKYVPIRNCGFIPVLYLTFTMNCLGTVVLFLFFISLLP